MTKKILMKVTSRERYGKMLSCVNAYIQFANNTKDMYWLFTFDKDDHTFDEAHFKNFIKEKNIDGKYILGVSKSKVDAINRDINLADFDKWDILLNISDDQFPVVYGYDDIIRERMPDNLDSSLWFLDSYQNMINTQEILGKNYYIQQGYIYHPSYQSLFCDNESTIVAQRAGKLISNDIILIKHIHPCNSRECQNDSLYQRNESYWNQDKLNYEKRYNHNFV